MECRDRGASDSGLQRSRVSSVEIPISSTFLDRCLSQLYSKSIEMNRTESRSVRVTGAFLGVSCNNVCKHSRLFLSRSPSVIARLRSSSKSMLSDLCRRIASADNTKLE